MSGAAPATASWDATRGRSIFEPPALQAAGRRAGPCASGPCQRRAPPAAEREPGDVLPDTSDSYDAPKFVHTRPRHFFDESIRANQYAVLLGREEAGRRPATARAAPAALELDAAQPLPLALRRVLSAVVPAASHPDFPPEAAARCAQEVETVLERLVARRPRAAAARPRPEAPGPAEAEGWGEPAGAAAPAPTGRLPSVPEAPEELPALPEGPLPTLLTSRAASEGLVEKVLIEMDRTEPTVDAQAKQQV